MEIIFQSVTMTCLVILAASAVVFPILFLVKLSRLNKILTQLLERIKEK